jgi:tetratricopeptide (TPR) repeat protein
MRRRLGHIVVTALFATALTAPLSAFAQGSRWLEPPSPNSPGQQRAGRTQNLDFLFEALKIAPTEESAKAIADRIWGLWLGAGGDTTNLLISRVRTAMEAKEFDLAVQLLDSVLEFKPEYVEGWNQRATVYFMKKDYTRALADLAQVLKREPRHFGALFGLGVIMQEFGDDKRALEVYRRALALDPHMQRVPELVRTLSEKVEGRDI